MFEQQSEFAEQLSLSTLQSPPPQTPPKHPREQQSRAVWHATPSARQTLAHASTPLMPVTGSQRLLQQSALAAHVAPAAWQLPPAGATHRPPLHRPEQQAPPCVQASPCSTHAGPAVVPPVVPAVPAPPPSMPSPAVLIPLHAPANAAANRNAPQSHAPSGRRCLPDPIAFTGTCGWGDRSNRRHRSRRWSGIGRTLRSPCRRSPSRRGRSCCWRCSRRHSGLDCRPGRFGSRLRGGS